MCSPLRTPSVNVIELTDEVKDRAIGCLFGQAIGDALGARYEFQSAESTKERISLETDIHGHLPILGGGVFNVVAGQITDDTELALGLARSLVRKDSFDLMDIANSYVSWFTSPGFGIGRTVGNSLWGAEHMDSPESRLRKMLKNSKKLNGASLSNGCLMRVSPLAIAGVNWPEEIVRKAGKCDCSLTNPNPVAKEAVGAYLTALRIAIRSGRGLDAYDAACRVATSDIIHTNLTASLEKPQPVIIPDGTEVVSFSKNMGYLGVALQGAFYELLHSTSFEAGMRNCMLRGGDTDTNGCITGALLGATMGASRIPNDWKTTVLRAKTERRVRQNPIGSTKDLPELAIKLLSVKIPKNSKLRI